MHQYGLTLIFAPASLQSVSGILLRRVMEDFRRDLPGGLSGNYVTKMREDSPAAKSARKSDSSKIKVRPKRLGQHYPKSFHQLRQLFRNAPCFSHLALHIVQVAQTEDLCIQLAEVEVVQVSNIQPFGTENTIWKIQHL